VLWFIFLPRLACTLDCCVPGIVACCSDTSSKEDAEVSVLMRQELEPLFVEMQVMPADCGT
jgi:hypothetical protein